jgi:hypothetical protein
MSKKKKTTTATKAGDARERYGSLKAGAHLAGYAAANVSYRITPITRYTEGFNAKRNPDRAEWKWRKAK